MHDILDEFNDPIIHLMRRANKDHTIAITLCGRIAPIKVIASYTKPLTCIDCTRIDDEALSISNSPHIKVT